MIVVELGAAPTRPLSINEERGLHWTRRRARLTPWRDTTYWVAKQGRLADLIENRRCHVTVVVPVTDRRRRDPHNYLPVAKAVVDGLVLAGVWPDDTPDYVTVTEPVLRHHTLGPAEIRLELTGEEPAS